MDADGRTMGTQILVHLLQSMAEGVRAEIALGDVALLFLGAALRHPKWAHEWLLASPLNDRPEFALAVEQLVHDHPIRAEVLP